MISKAKLKKYQQLGSKKFRQKYGLFVVEGLKSVNELIKSDWSVQFILCTPSFNELCASEIDYHFEVIHEADFLKISSQKKPQGILAIVEQKELDEKKSSWQIALDGINDPGNLGTIIRIADWYGIHTIYMSDSTVDLYNPKTIQSSMGSFLRVKPIHGDLSILLKNKNVYAACMEGENIRTLNKPKGGVILIGNEANGISLTLHKDLNFTQITIPRSGKAESLNAAIATAICCERLLH